MMGFVNFINSNIGPHQAALYDLLRVLIAQNPDKKLNRKAVNIGFGLYSCRGGVGHVAHNEWIW